MSHKDSATKKLCIVGAGGHGRVVAEIAAAVGYKDICFVDSSFPKIKTALSRDIVGADLSAVNSDYHVFVALGDNKARMIQIERAVAENRILPNLVHPAAVISENVTMEAGTVVMAGVIVNSGTRIGVGVILNTRSTIDHDCVIEDGAHIAPGALLAGGVHVGRGSWVGIGALVRENVHIGSNAIVGAGTLVLHDVVPETCVVGRPARRLER